jgi:hypothetical protein
MGDCPNVEIFAAGDGPDAGAFQEWGRQLRAFTQTRSQTAFMSLVNPGDGWGANPSAFDSIVARLRRRTDAADGKQLNTVAVFCHGEAFAVGVGITLHNVDALAQEIANHADAAQPFRLAYFACMAGASNPSLSSRHDGTFGDQRGNGGLCEATCASLIAAGLTKVQVDGHYSYGIGNNNPQLRRFFSEGMYPNFIRYAVGAQPGGSRVAVGDAIPPAPATARPARPGNAPAVEDPRPSLCAYYRSSPPAELTPTDRKKLAPNIPPKPNVYRTTVDLDAPGAGFTGTMHALYSSGSYWLPAMYSSIQKIWADTYARLPNVTPPAGLIPSPLPGRELDPASW